MRMLFVGLFVIGMALLPSPARAQFFSGTVRGNVSAPEPRENPYTQAGYLSSSPTGARQAISTGSSQHMMQMLVRVRITDFVTTTYYTRTNGAGNYSVPWSHLWPPNKIEVDVFPARPEIDTVPTTSKPTNWFEIRGYGGIAMVSLRGASRSSGTLTGTQTINLTLPANSEFVAAFQTARDTYRMIHAEGGGAATIGDMLGLKIFVNDATLGVGGGIAPLADEIYLSPGLARQRPFSVAHEIGHILTWRSFDISAAPASLALAYLCDGNPGWADFTDECEQAGFLDGVAHLVGALWMWNRNASPLHSSLASPVIPRGSMNFSIEAPQQLPGTPLARGCHKTFGHPPGRVACNARALWDIVDNPVGDDDAISNRSLSHIITVLRAYPRFWNPACLINDNHCVLEAGLNDGMNWHDFRANWTSVFGTSQNGALDAISAAVDVNFADPN